MLQLCPLDMLKEQEQSLLHSLLSNKPSEACATNVIPHFNELHLLRINSIAVMIVIFAAINRDHRNRDTLRIIPSTKENPVHVSTKQSLTLLCDDSRCPLTVTSGGAITTTAAGVRRTCQISRGGLRNATVPLEEEKSMDLVNASDKG